MEKIHLPYDDECCYNSLSGYTFGEFKYHFDDNHFLEKYYELFSTTKIKLDISCAIDLKKFNIVFNTIAPSNMN